MRCACRRWAAKLWGNRWAAKLWAAKLWGNQIRTLASTGGRKRRDLPAHFRMRRTPTRSFHVCFEASVSRLARLGPSTKTRGRKGVCRTNQHRSEEERLVLEVGSGAQSLPLAKTFNHPDAAFHSFDMRVIHDCLPALGSCAVGSCTDSARDAGRCATG